MRAEATVPLDEYLARAPDREREPLRFRWHLERYRFALAQTGTGGRAADVGCGTGFGSRELSTACAEVHAFDINPALVRWLRRQMPDDRIRFSVFDVHRGRLPGAPYDLVCAFEVVEHLEEPGRALDNLASSLGETGVLVLSTPNEAGDSPGSHPFHVSSFDPASLGALLDDRFPSVELYSQGTPSLRHELERHKATSRLVSAVRIVDRLRLRRWLPDGVRHLLLRRLVGVDPRRVRSEVTDIRPGAEPEARWLVAICRN